VIEIVRVEICNFDQVPTLRVVGASEYPAVIRSGSNRKRVLTFWASIDDEIMLALERGERVKEVGLCLSEFISNQIARNAVDTGHEGVQSRTQLCDKSFASFAIKISAYCREDDADEDQRSYYVY
jgi:hypothetical protein